MSIRGEFRFADGRVLSNNVMLEGRQQLLALALQGIDSVVIPAAGNFYLGLCQGVPDVDVAYTELTEPTIGVNGYGRLPVTRDTVGFPTSGVAGGEPYVESKQLVFTPTGSGFDQPITRLFLGKESTSLLGNIWAMSEPLAAPLTLLPTTPIASRTFTYRLYMR